MWHMCSDLSPNKLIELQLSTPYQQSKTSPVSLPNRGGANPKTVSLQLAAYGMTLAM